MVSVEELYWFFFMYIVFENKIVNIIFLVKNLYLSKEKVLIF